jgi:hypothetical protein
VPVLIPLITLIIAGAALGALWAVKSGDHGQDVSGGQTTVVGPPTSIVVASTTESVVSTTQTVLEATTTTMPETTTTGPGAQTTLSGAGDKWQKSPISLAGLRTQLAQSLPAGQTLYLPDHLPQGWAIAAPGQDYGDIAAGYFADMHTNPSTNTQEGDSGPFGEYWVCFTNGAEVVGMMAVIGDWGETQFEDVTAYGKKLWLYQDDSMVAVGIPGWDVGAVVGSAGAREAALEIAAAIKAW